MQSQYDIHQTLHLAHVEHVVVVVLRLKDLSGDAALACDGEGVCDDDTNACDDDEIVRQSRHSTVVQVSHHDHLRVVWWFGNVI